MDENWLRKRFRAVEFAARNDVITLLGELRKSRPTTDFASIFRAFKTAAPVSYSSLCAVGPRHPFELVWKKNVLAPTTLENELLWAHHWLIGHSARINAFRRRANLIQQEIIKEKFASALQVLDEYTSQAGWSLWAVELRSALLQLIGGNATQRAWLEQLQAKALNSVPGLLFEIFADRNDDSYSYDAIYSKCMNSFPRFGALAPWLVDYLQFRALGRVENPEEALPHILCRDITSSLVDYYEDVLEAVTYIEGHNDLASLRPVAGALVASLLETGFLDHRLQKIAITLNVSTNTPNIDALPEDSYRTLYFGGTAPAGLGLMPSIEEGLKICQQDGAAAYELAGKLVKWGLNLRGLDMGQAVASSALCATTDSADSRAVLLGMTLMSEKFCIDDAIALPPEQALRLFEAYCTQHSLESHSDSLFKPSSWNIDTIFPNTGPFCLWLAYRLLERGDFGELQSLIEVLSPRNAYWHRQCAKLKALSSIKKGEVESALHVLDEWYRRNPHYSMEFSADLLFRNNNWRDLKELDPVVVGLVAHREFEARGDSNVGFICKMACRSFLLSGMRDSVHLDFDTATALRKEQLIVFLRDVWVEQNLSLCHQFQSTSEVRTERMGVLQLLLSWESDRAQVYAEAIKDLTFDQTLQQGLERIDQTRIFVNESAITRWAEKELEQDYERWRKLTESSSGGRSVDELLRQYVLDPLNADVLTEFANGKPTAADALLIDLLDRLFKRFLLDPADGLDAYLSVRIRHGSLRGTILGPLEEQGLLYSSKGFSESAFSARWDGQLWLPAQEKQQLIVMLQEFSDEVRRIVDSFIEQRVQIHRDEKPMGAFLQTLSSFFAKLIAVTLAERPPTFHAFLCQAYFVYWKIIESGLKSLKDYVDEILAPSLYSRLERLMHDLRGLGNRYGPLVTTLTTVSTLTKSQCDTVADWFQLPSLVGSERYILPDAIEIASVATKNVHRAFPAQIELLCLPSVQLPLTTSGLAVLMDCLFVVFENAWKHSGLYEELPPIQLYSEFDSGTRLLTIICRSSLSAGRLFELIEQGELTSLRTKYLGELPLELISLEGGSGFPKLARLARAVPKDVCPQPFDFGVDENRWYTSVTVPLYDREGAYEAYE